MKTELVSSIQQGWCSTSCFIGAGAFEKVMFNIMVDVATQLSNVSEAINAEEIETLERPKLVRSTNMDKNIDRDADNVSEGAGLGAHLQ